jgi:hypothetical protein
MLIDALARQLGIHVDKLQHNAATGRGKFCDKRVLLVKPMTFMNLSGEAVGKLARYYKVGPHTSMSPTSAATLLKVISKLRLCGLMRNKVLQVHARSTAEADMSIKQQRA